jgi:apolipoprotein D and lipocalin family protein
MASVDLAKYAGSWYEIARLPMFFQRHCVASKAVYRVRPDQSFDVHNECLTASGHTATAEAAATVVDPATNARLRVVFDNFFARLASPSNEGNYWILHVDADYRTALVGTPDRRYLWILARSKRLDDGVYQRLVDLARTLGYPVDTLIRDQWPDAS